MEKIISEASVLLAALKECSGSKDLLKARGIHHQASNNGLLSNKFVVSSLINIYSKCGSMVDARKVFDSSSHLLCPDVVSWTALITGYAKNGESELALETFRCMEIHCAPNSRTFLAALCACADLAVKHKGDGVKFQRLLQRGRALHSQALLLRCCDIFVETTLIGFYARCSCMAEGRRVFDGMNRRNVVAWTALLQGYVENGECEIALEMFNNIMINQRSFVPDSRIYVAALTAVAAMAETKHQDGKKLRRWFEKGKEIHSQAVATRCCDIFVETTMVDVYAKFGEMLLARNLFENMRKRNVVAWNALILGYVNAGENELALELVSAMDSEAGVVRNSATYVVAIMACGNLLAVERGQGFHEEACNCGLEKDLTVANSLVDFYGKCGCMEAANEVFCEIARKDVVSWTALMCGYCLQGNSHRVSELFEDMKEGGIAPNEATFVCLLTACSRAGLTEKGREYFGVMRSEYGIDPSIQHYSCMVDLLGRANCLEEAVRLVRGMPFDANGIIWRVILSASRKWNNAAVGRVAYESLMRFDARDARGYVFLAGTLIDSSTASAGDATGKMHKF